MKRIKIILFCISFGLSFFFAQGQQIGNYVSNGSFEEFYNCKSTELTVSKSWLPIDSLSFAGSWFSSCNGYAPTSQSTYQQPRTGNSYIISSFYAIGSTRGYPKNRLKGTLQPGKSYCISFYVNITDYSPYGMNGFGAYFSNGSIDTISKCNIPLTYINPQIFNPTNIIISDTVNWVKISGTFQATGSEKYLLLGNFLGDNNTAIDSLNPSYWPAKFTDLFIDDVSCVELNLPAFAGPDKTIISGDSVFIGRQPDFAIDPGCMWFKHPNVVTAIDTISGLWVKPSVTTTYIVRQELECSSVKWDTVVIFLSGVGIDEHQMFGDKITLFPNPTSANLNISCSDFASGDLRTLSIFSNIGQLIMNGNIELNKTSIDIEISDLSPGLYQIRFETRFGPVTKKFVKATD